MPLVKTCGTCIHHDKNTDNCLEPIYTETHKFTCGLRMEKWKWNGLKDLKGEVK